MNTRKKLTAFAVLFLFTSVQFAFAAELDPMGVSTLHESQPQPGYFYDEVESLVDNRNTVLTLTQAAQPPATNFVVNFTLQPPISGPYVSVRVGRKGHKIGITGTGSIPGESDVFVINLANRSATYDRGSFSASLGNNRIGYGAILKAAKLPLEKALANQAINLPSNADAKSRIEKTLAKINQLLLNVERVQSTPDGFIAYVQNVSIEKKGNILITQIANHRYGTERFVVDLSQPGAAVITHTLGTGATTQYREGRDSLFSILLSQNLNLASSSAQSTNNVPLRTALNAAYYFLRDYAGRNRVVTPASVDASIISQNGRVVSATAPSQFQLGFVANYTYQYDANNNLVSITESYGQTVGTTLFENGRRVSARYVSQVPPNQAGTLRVTYDVIYYYDSSGKETGYTTQITNTYANRDEFAGTILGTNLYDAAGRLDRTEETIDSVYNSTKRYRLIQNTYNQLGALIQQAEYFSNGTSPLPQANDPFSVIQFYTSGRLVNGKPVADRVQTFDSLGLLRQEDYRYPFQPPATFAAQSPDGKLKVYFVAASNRNLSSIRLQDAVTGELIREIPVEAFLGLGNVANPSFAYSVQFTPDSRYFGVLLSHLVPAPRGTAFVPTPCILRIYDTQGQLANEISKDSSNRPLFIHTLQNAYNQRLGFVRITYQPLTDWPNSYTLGQVVTEDFPI